MNYLLSLLSLLFLTLSYPLRAQSDAERKLVLTLLPADPESNLDVSQQGKLTNTVTGLLTQNGLASKTLPGSLVLVPTVRIINEQSLNPGLQTLIVIDSELNLTIQQADRSTVFSTITKRLRGSGRTRELALNNLLGQIDVDDPTLTDFLRAGKQKAFDYYKKECTTIVARAAQSTRLNQFASAFGLLLSIPQGTDCYERVQSQTMATFRQYQQQTCQRLLQRARTRLANRDFDGVLALAEQIDPQSPCAAETRKLIDQAARETSAENQRRWQALSAAFADYRELERYRFRIMSELAAGYYQTLPLYR